jgi:hypothetical protein
MNSLDERLKTVEDEIKAVEVNLLKSKLLNLSSKGESNAEKEYLRKKNGFWNQMHLDCICC